MIQYLNKAEKHLRKAIKEKNVNEYHVARDAIQSMLRRPQTSLTIEQKNHFKNLLNLKI
jgi:uncharacterized protein (DUF2267 family)